MTTHNNTMPILFDTHAFVKHLTSSGFTEQQAEALAEEQVHLIENKLATKQDFLLFQQATKQDIDLLRQETKQDIYSLRQETKQDIHSLRQDMKNEIKTVKTDMKALEMRMTIKLGSMMIAGLGIFTTINKLF